MVWGIQADVNSLYHVLPNMKGPDACGARLYARGELRAVAGPVSGGGAGERGPLCLCAGCSRGCMRRSEQVSPRIYPGTRKAVESLLLLTPRLFSPGGKGAERLWRVKYPNGRWSDWHPSREAAEADLMANVSMMFSAACSAKRDLIRSWEWHAATGGRNGIPII